MQTEDIELTPLEVFIYLDPSEDDTEDTDMRGSYALYA